MTLDTARKDSAETRATKRAKIAKDFISQV